MTRRILFLSIFLSVFTPAQTVKEFGKQFGNVDYLSALQLKDYLSFISSDELEGRDTPSNGLNTAAHFIATLLSRWGFEPKGDSGSYFQKIELLKSIVLSDKSSLELQGKKLEFGTDFISNEEEASFAASLVYVNNGYLVPDKRIDPYKGIDVKGKVMVVLSGMPKGMRRRDFAGMKRGVDYESPQSFAVKHDAAAIMYIPAPLMLQRWEQDKNNASIRGDVKVLRFQNLEERNIPTITLSSDAVKRLFEDEHLSSDRDSLSLTPSFEFPINQKIKVRISTVVDTVFTQNIVAVLKGNDEKLKHEYVAFTAHYDHLGIGSPVNGDSIYNGADDDGSGTASLIAMAEAYANSPKPKRSMLFVWHCGEEKGLWGSKYFVEYPTIPLQNIITDLNLDMIGRSKPNVGPESQNENLSGPDEIFVIGSKMMNTQLGDIAEQVNASLFDMKFNYKFDDPKDPLRLYYRSDHYNYAKNGIPIIFYFDGLHEDYHQVSDEIGKIDFQKYLKVTKTIFATGWYLANMPTRPIVDKHVQKVTGD